MWTCILCKLAQGQRRPRASSFVSVPALFSDLFADSGGSSFTMHLLCKGSVHSRGFRRQTLSRKLGDFTEAWSLHLLASNDQTRNFKLRVTEWEGWVSYKQRVISDHGGSPFKSRSAVTSSDISSFPHQNASSVPYLPAFCLPPLSSSLHFRNPFCVGPVWFCGSE